MKKTYYLFNPGRVSRKDNTLKIQGFDDDKEPLKAKYLPVEGVESLFIFGSIDANSALYNFLGRKSVPVHFFDYYEHYTGSFQPKEYLLAGKFQIAQTKCFLNKKQRLYIAQKIVSGASFNMLKNLKYYALRDRKIADEIEFIESCRSQIDSTRAVDELMGLEGNMRKVYYQTFEQIIPGFTMDGRSKQPPKNELNSLVSFGNMMCYTQCLDQIYHTQLNPTISFLHSPGYRRYSLALDFAEIFKPILVDRTIFKVLNKGMIKETDFKEGLRGFMLSDRGKKCFIQSFEERLKETITHRSLRRKVSYKQLIRLECYKLIKFILRMEKEYKPFKIWW